VGLWACSFDGPAESLRRRHSMRRRGDRVGGRDPVGGLWLARRKTRSAHARAVAG
jgi:hypothetical protein